MFNRHQKGELESQENVIKVRVMERLIRKMMNQIAMRSHSLV